MTAPTFAERGWRFYADDGRPGTALAAENNTGGTIAIDTPFHVRFEIDNDNNKASNNQTFYLYYRRNGGTWTQVTTTDTYVRVTTGGSHLTDGYGTTSTDENRLTTSTATWLAYEESTDEDVGDGGYLDYAGNDQCEVMWCVYATNSCSASDYLEFRVYKGVGTPIGTYPGTDAYITLTAGASNIAMGAVTLASSPQSASVSAIGPQTINMGYASLASSPQALSVSTPAGVTVAQLIGFETGGLEEAVGTAGSPAVNNTRVRTGSYSLQMGASSAWYKFRGVEPGEVTSLDTSKGLLVEFYINFDTLTPAADQYFFTVISNWPSETSWPWYMRLNTDNTITIHDVAADRIVDADCGLQADTWHKFQIYWTYGDAPQTITLYVDGEQKGTASNCDTSTGGSLTKDSLVYRFYNDGTNLPVYYIDDVVSKVHCNGVSDRYENGFEVIGGYQNTAEDATDQGSTLDDGTWADASEIPFSDDVSPNLATFTGNGDAGHMRTDEGTRSGPGSEINGTPRAAGFVHRMDFLGTSTPVYQRLGKYTSGGSDSYSDEEITPTTSPVNYKFVTQSTSLVPQTTSDYFVLGMSLQVASQEIYLHEAVAFLLQEVSANPTISMGYITATALAQALSVVPGSISIQAGAATLVSSAQALSVSAPPPAQNIGMGYANLVSSIQSLTVQAGTVTVVMSYATLSSSPQSLTLQAGAIQVTMGYVTLTGSPQSAMVSAGTSTIQMGAVTLAGSPQALSLSTGAVSIAMGAISLASSPQAARITIGASIISMGYVELVSSVQSLDAVPGAVVIQMGSVTLSGTINALQVVSIGASQSIAMSYATLASSVQSLAVVPGAAIIPMAQAELVGSLQSLNISLAALILAMGYLTLTGSAESLDVNVEIVTTPSIWHIRKVIKRETTAQRYNRLNRLW